MEKKTPTTLEKASSTTKKNTKQEDNVLDYKEGFLFSKIKSSLIWCIITHAIFLIPIFIWGIESFTHIVATIIYGIVLLLLSSLFGYASGATGGAFLLERRRYRAKRILEKTSFATTIATMIMIIALAVFVTACIMWSSSEVLQVALFYVFSGTFEIFLYFVCCHAEIKFNACPVCDEVQMMELANTQTETEKKQLYRWEKGHYEHVGKSTQHIRSLSRPDYDEVVNHSVWVKGHEVEDGTDVKATTLMTYKCKKCGHIKIKKKVEHNIEKQK